MQYWTMSCLSNNVLTVYPAVDFAVNFTSDLLILMYLGSRRWLDDFVIQNPVLDINNRRRRVHCPEENCRNTEFTLTVRIWQKNWQKMFDEQFRTFPKKWCVEQLNMEDKEMRRLSARTETWFWIYCMVWFKNNHFNSSVMSRSARG